MSEPFLWVAAPSMTCRRRKRLRSPNLWYSRTRQIGSSAKQTPRSLVMLTSFRYAIILASRSKFSLYMKTTCYVGHTQQCIGLSA